MTRLLLRRLVWALPTLFGMSVLTFAVVALTPGTGQPPSPDDALRPSPSASTSRPSVPRQYVDWSLGLLKGELGTSLVDQQPIAKKLATALPRTVVVSTAALSLAWLVAVPTGVWLAVNERRRLARVASAALAVLYGVPTFWLSVLALLAFATPRGLELFPLQGLSSAEPARTGALDTLWHLVLPVSCAAIPLGAFVTRLVRGHMLGALAQDFVLAARARGLPESTVVWRHALRSVAGPLLAALSAQLPYVVSGAVVIERVFGIAGMGLLALDAASARDLPTVMAVAVVMAAVTLGSLILSDVAQALVDPRVRLEDAT